MRQRGRRWLNSAFGRAFQGAFERKLNLACGFLPRLTMRHDAGPFDYLGDEAFVRLLRPNTKSGFHNLADRAAWFSSKSEQ